MKLNKLKRLTAAFLAALFCMPAVGANAAAGDLLYESKDIQTITEGVTYEKSTRLYKAGWMDVYVLTIDAANDNVEFDVMQSTREFGLKQSVLQMAQDNNLLAAVNADFFGSGNPFSAMGQVAEDGKMQSAQNYYNGSENKYAGFFVDTAGVPFIDYVKSTMGFYAGANAAFEMGAKNKITNFAKPVYFDRFAMNDTAQLDKRVSGLSKIVVENGVITKLSAVGETVTVPENGYIIVMNKATRDAKMGYYLVGMKVTFNENNSFVFRPSKTMSNILTGVTGGGELLRNGQNVQQGLIIGKNARNPRTLIGVNQDKTKVIIMCIDGRANGIGATHVEAANLMREYGAWDAIHFDGGGSTTMAARQENTSALSVVNVPSEGSQRLIANGFGVRSKGNDKELASLNVVIADNANEDNYLFNGVKTGFYVYGYDGNHNPVEVDKNKLEFFSTVEGVWQDNYFTPSTTGTGTITAKIGSITGTLDVRVLKGANNIAVSANTPVLSIGQSTQLVTSCINADGYRLAAGASSINYSVDNEEIGTVENGYFVAKGNGLATITAEVNGFKGTTKVAVGKVLQSVYGFENAADTFTSIYFPEDSGIRGGGVISSLAASQGTMSVRMDYLFNDNLTTTQCVYASLKKPVSLPEHTADAVFDYKGDGTGNMLKAQIKDSSNRYYNIEITPAMTDSEWHTVQVPLPSEAVQPVTVEKLYVAALSTAGTNVRGTVYVDNIGAMVPANAPENPAAYFTDYMNRDMAQTEGIEDIAIFGQTAAYSGNDKDSLMNGILAKMAAGSRAMVLVGNTSVKNATGITAVSWNNKYATNGTENFDIINLATGNGNIRTSNPDQWRWLQGYLSTSQKNNIIVNMDKYVWGSGSSALTDAKEAQLLHSILKKYAAETGKNVMVVSATGTSNFVNVKEGVRYVNLAGLSSAKKQYLRVRTNGTDMYYQFIDA